MTTLTQSELDYTRRKTQDGTRLGLGEVLALLDHIAQLTAERDEAIADNDDCHFEIAGKDTRIVELEAENKTLNIALDMAVEGQNRTNEYLDKKQDRIAELEAQPSAQFVAGMRRAAEMLKVSRAEMLLNAGEMTAQELRSVNAVLDWRVRVILAEAAALKGK